MEHESRSPGRSARQVVPALPAPEPYAERRRSFRRTEDQAVHEDRALLARALDVLAGPGDAATQVAEILALAARTVGARRAAVVTDRPMRQALVAAAPDEDPAAARALAAWLDAHAPRPAAVRAATAPAEVIVVRTRQGPPGRTSARAPAGSPDGRLVRFDLGGADVQLGLELAAAADAPAVAARLPASTLRHLLAALAAASARAGGEAERVLLHAREREREHFVSMVAHELRTPLTGLGGYLDLLAAGAVDDPAVGREFIERGRGIVEQMANLVGDLLEVSRLDAGGLQLEIEPTSLTEACERAVAALAPLAAARGIRLASTLPPRVRTARADRRRLEQVVTNLLGNACKFAPDGGLVEVTARIDGPVALITVRDDGPGIERADRERVFRPFARLESHARVQGTGLGLPISRDLARAMGGELGLASVAGSGSSFVLALPAREDVAPPAMEAALDVAVAAEELGLEERAVLRAVRGGVPPPATPRRAAAPGPPGES